MVNPYRDKWASGAWDCPCYRRRRRKRWFNIIPFPARPSAGEKAVAVLDLTPVDAAAATMRARP